MYSIHKLILFKDKIISFLKGFTSSGSLKSNLLKIVSANVLLTVLSLVFTPIFSRVFSPEDYGINAIFSTVITLGSVIIHLTYSDAIVFAKSDEDTLSLTILSTILSIAFCLLLTLILWVHPETLAYVNLEPLVPYWYMVPITLFIVTITGIFGNMLTRVNDFSTKSKTIISRNIINRLSTLAWGYYLSPKYLGFVVGWAVGFGVNIPLQISKKAKVRFTNLTFSISSLKPAFRKYINYPKYFLASTIFEYVRNSFPVLFLGYFFSKGEIGQYSFALTLLGIPISYFSSSLKRTLSITAVEAYSESKTKFEKLISKVTSFSIILGSIPFAILIAFSTEIFTVFLGSQWTKAGYLASFLGGYYYMLMINGPLMNILNIVNRERDFIFIHTTSLIITFSSLSIGIFYNNNFDLSIIYYAISSFVFLFIVNLYVLYFAGLNLSVVLKKFSISLMIFLAVFAIKQLYLML